ncbi:MAG: hypothetical protein BWY66_00827 [bacterium ADurb.Bin374]|nr:MAG: hypothetical protein BWY66_00827 [bacterium ADurb.Bin374]
MSLWVATTGFTIRPVISWMSSIAMMFSGSTMATVSLFPTLLIGISMWRLAMCSGTSFAMTGSIR